MFGTKKAAAETETEAEAEAEAAKTARVEAILVR